MYDYNMKSKSVCLTSLMPTLTPSILEPNCLVFCTVAINCSKLNQTCNGTLRIFIKAQMTFILRFSCTCAFRGCLKGENTET